MDEATHKFDHLDLPDPDHSGPPGEHGTWANSIFTHAHAHDRHVRGPDHSPDFSHRHEHRWAPVEDHHHPIDPADDVRAAAVDHAADPLDPGLD
jgi:hypothetical protein